VEEAVHYYRLELYSATTTWRLTWGSSSTSATARGAISADDLAELEKRKSEFVKEAKAAAKQAFAAAAEKLKEHKQKEQVWLDELRKQKKRKVGS